MLKPSIIFALFLRILGVIVFLYGCHYIADFFLGVTGYFTTQHTDYATYVILGICYLIVGMYLTRGAPAIVDYAYPNDEKEFFEERITEIAAENQDENLSSRNS